MKRASFLFLEGICFALLLAVVGCATTSPTAIATKDIPEDFSKISLDDPGAFEFANSCGLFDITEEQFANGVKSARANKTSSTRSDRKGEPYISFSGNNVYCVERSRYGHPVLPRSVFDKTIVFNGMPEEQVTRLRAALSEQLALTGSASALVMHPEGNAYVISYLFAGVKPERIYYRSSWIDAADIVLQDYGFVMEDAKYKTVSTTDRGSSRVFMKRFFDESGD